MNCGTACDQRKSDATQFFKKDLFLFLLNVTMKAKTGAFLFVYLCGNCRLTKIRSLVFIFIYKYSCICYLQILHSLFLLWIAYFHLYLALQDYFPLLFFEIWKWNLFFHFSLFCALFRWVIPYFVIITVFSRNSLYIFQYLQFTLVL